MTIAQAILALLGTIAGIVAVVLTHRYDATAARASSIAEARKELQATLATKKFDDAAFWARRLRDLNALPIDTQDPTS
ncbi:MAG: hypothetical protein WCI17_12165 [bacterium]